MFLIDWNMGLSYTSNARTGICFVKDKNTLLLAPLRMLRCNTDRGRHAARLKVNLLDMQFKKTAVFIHSAMVSIHDLWLDYGVD